MAIESLPPAKAIREYCLRSCELKDKDNSQRAVVECSNHKCYLYQWRTGVNSLKRKPYATWAKEERLKELERERNKLETANRRLERAKDFYQKKEAELEEAGRMVELREKHKEEVRETIREIEKTFTDELMGGLWG